MKKLILLAALTMVLPKHQPMFPDMIVRCDEDGKCHWECEFGVVTSTTMVNENLIVKPSGCGRKPELSNEIITIPQYKQYWNNNLIPL